MHCRSCEVVIEKELLNISGVKRVDVSHKHGEATLYSDSAIHEVDVISAVARAGYSLGKDKKRDWIAKDAEIYFRILFAGVSLVALYLVLKIIGITDLSFSFGDSPSYATVLLIGLTAGISTCMALIGGLVLGVSAAHAVKHPEATRMQKFRPHAFFNFGRILGYAVLGGLIGFLGSAFQISSVAYGILIVAVGLVMLILGLKLTELFPVLERMQFALPSGLARRFGLSKEVREYSHTQSLLLGAATFFVPCGFTQAMQIYAVSTGSFVRGALIMGFFALGTAPGLLGLGGITSAVSGGIKKWFFAFAGLLVIFFGATNIVGGIRLTGFDLSVIRRDSAPDAAVKIVDGIQIVKMEQRGNGYFPNKFTVKKGVPVRWVINATDAYTCASYIVVPKLGVKRALELGENIITFTPQEVGTLRFTCSMGMYSGTFTVVE